MVREKLVLKKKIKMMIKKMMYTIIIFLLGMIAVKEKPELKDSINNFVYKDSPNYLYVRKIYNKYFGKFTFDKKETQAVFSEKIKYCKKDNYKNGVMLSDDSNYMVPVIESGIIIYLENKKVIISQVNGINTEYSNINASNYKLYDYVEKGKLLGEVDGNKLYLSFEKEGKYLDYKKYI